MEHHPRTKISKPVIDNQRIILGSFPTWSLTDPDPEKNENLSQKEEARKKNGDVQFYYGSSINRFWNWYKKYIDSSAVKGNLDTIQNSLLKNDIGITDVIISCSRKNKSALDKHLTKRTYNHQFFNYPKKGETLKILCTSKGVLNEMLLNSKFFKLHDSLIINLEESEINQKKITNTLNGNSNLVRNPFYRILEMESGGTIECMCTPSPGSPYRRLVDFGCTTEDADTFLDEYLSFVFNWFLS